MSLLFLLLLVLILLSFSGWGYGYYRGGAYASPMGIVGAILIVCLLFWLFFGGGAIWGPGPY